jgi:hypothetical protein
MKATLLIILTLLSLSSSAQEIAGIITDERREPLTGGMVAVYQSTVLKGSIATDFDGYYVIKPIDNGYYDLLFTMAGYDSVKYLKVVVSAGAQTKVNFYTCKKPQATATLIIKNYKKPLIAQPGHDFVDGELKVLHDNSVLPGGQRH